MLNQTSSMKITRILSLIAVTAIAFSCSKDDDAKPSLEEAKISIAGNQQVIETPAALLSNENEYAQMVAEAIMEANALSTNLALFTPPAGATKSTEIIVPANGRAAATQGEALVYIWSDDQGQTVAYQIRDQSTKYTFELFYKDSNTSSWYRMLYAEELKDHSMGHMELYDIFGATDEESSAVWIRWDWTRNGDLFNYTVSSDMFGFKYIIDYNTKTKAGVIQWYLLYETAYELEYKLTWDAQGHGTWEYYSEGVVTENGVW
jgi:hypothetical protein